MKLRLYEIDIGDLFSNSQATALGLGHRFEEVENLYAACNQLLGRPIKVTPSSKVVGDLALHLVASGVTREQLLTEPVLPSPLFWYGLDVNDDEASVGLDRGVRLLLGLRSIGEANEDGIRRVSFTVNGQT